MSGLLISASFEKRVRALHTLIRPAVVGPRGERPTHTTIASAETFEKSLDGPAGLIQRVEQRKKDWVPPESAAMATRVRVWSVAAPGLSHDAADTTSRWNAVVRRNM
jgi:hypothetical protein